MNRVTVRRFDVVRTANIVAALYAVIIVVMMLVVFLPMMLIGGLAGFVGAGGDSGTGAAFLGVGVITSLVFVVLGALFYAAAGWVMTAIMVLLYNWLAGRIGGFQIDVQIEGPVPGAYPPYGGYPAPGYAPGHASAAGQPQWPVPGSPGAPTAPGAPGQPGGEGGPGQPPAGFQSGY